MAILFASPLSMSRMIELIEARIPPVVIMVTAISVVVDLIALGVAIALLRTGIDEMTVGPRGFFSTRRRLRGRLRMSISGDRMK